MEENNCIFCQVIAGKVGSLVWQNDYCVAFNDIHPKAPIHVLVVPREHIARLTDVADMAAAGQLLLAANIVAKQLAVQDAFRLHVNNGRAAGQEVDHLHMHLLAGKLDKKALHQVGM